MILNILIISIIGTLLHFVYEWSNHNKFVALFAAVNESTWEHIKIALTPTILFSIYDGLIYGANPNYLFAKFISLLSLVLIIPILFYGYQIITKKSYLIIDIIIFYIAIIVSQILFSYILNLNNLGFAFNYIGLFGIFIIFALYLVLTMLPIKNFIFKDPITNKYGIKGHSHEHEHKH